MVAFLSPQRLARLGTRHPWAVLAAWGLFLVLGVGAASTIGDVVSTASPNYQATEAETANDLLTSQLYGELPGRETVVVQSDRWSVTDAAFKTMVTSMVGEFRALDADVASVLSLYEAEVPGLTSPDGHTLLIPVTLHGSIDDAADHIEGLTRVTAAHDGVDGFTVVSGGDGTAAAAFEHQSETDLQTAEVLGLPIAAVVLVLVFGALGAASLPIVLGVVSIVVAIGVSALIGRAFDLSVFLVNMITMMGMAVGVDYCLVIIQRVREERDRGTPRDEAIVRAGETASRAVLFSGLTVIVALAGMLLVPNGVFRSLSIGAMVVVAMAVLAALTLLPAVLRLLGDRVNAGRLPFRRGSSEAEGESFWGRAAGVVTGHPALFAIAAVALLVSAALPYSTIKLGWLGASTLPANAEARRAFEILNDEFSAGVIAPTDIVVTAYDVRAPTVAGGIDALLAALKADGEFGTPLSVESNEAHTLLLARVPLNSDPLGSEASRAIERLRKTYIPSAFGDTGATALVAGATAKGIDDTALITSHTIEVFAFVLGLSFLLLMLVFRSVVVPVNAILMNLLSVGAAYGLMVLVFQHGVGNEWFGFTHVEAVESWVPLFMFSVLFGLSMDYHVFLLSRIRERFEETRDNTDSIRFGIASTAGLITGAAAIMIAVFAGFAAGELVAFQQMGFGLAVAVLLDATVVRTVLVPASMQLLGRWNWYFPGWLSWLPRIDIEARPAIEHGAERAPRPLPVVD